MSNARLLKEMEKDLMEKAKEKYSNFVYLCLDVGDVKMRHIVPASDFYIDEDNLSIEVENFVLSITPRDCFKIEKNKNDIETEYVLTNGSSNLYIVI